MNFTLAGRPSRIFCHTLDAPTFGSSIQKKNLRTLEPQEKRQFHLLKKRDERLKRPPTGRHVPGPHQKVVAARTLVLYFHNLPTVAQPSQHEGLWTPKRAKTRADNAFPLGARRASSAKQATRARAPAKRIDARQDPTNERRADSSQPCAFQHWNTGRRPLCPNVSMRDHLAVDDTRPSQPTRATREGREGIASSDPQRSKTQTQPRVPPSSSERPHSRRNRV